MKMSLRWLNEFVDVSDFFDRPDQLAAHLTAAGLEVEEITDLAQPYRHVQVGLILEKEKHPDADKLSVCKVTTGDGILHQIVCGAKNHKANDRVIVALPGALLPGNFAIKNSVIRGVASGGMLCSYKELGMADTSEGIAILAEDAPVGKPYAEVAGMNDVTFELKVTPNRADCLSHMGLAREISCLLDRPFKLAPVKKFEFEGSVNPPFRIDVLEPQMCPRYTGQIIKGVNVGPSPQWLKQRLEIVGLNSINNVVDITNYVMMERGQPLHAFDLGQIEGGVLKIGKAKAQERFTTLDGTELTLRGDELMIQDGSRSLCMAGVIGGRNSGVSEKTQDLFLEAAYFAPQFVRRGARGHGLNTDSGYRFTRGVDPTHTKEALHRAVELLVQVAGGSAASPVIEVRQPEVQSQPIYCSPALVSARLGYEVDTGKLESWLTRLGCRVTKENEGYRVWPPTWRFDIEGEMDLVEEYARLNGYEHIPETLPPLAKPPTHHDQTFGFQSKVTEMMTSLGFAQAINFAFVSDEKQKIFIKDKEALLRAGLMMPSEEVRLLNPLNEQLNVMRAILSLGLLDNVQHNFNYGVESGRLFEVGSTFEKSSGSYKERQRWAGIAWGWDSNLWTVGTKVPVVLDLKGAVENILNQLGFKSWSWVALNEPGLAPGFLHPGQSVALKVEGQNIGFLGSLHPQVRDDLKLRVDVAVFEFEAEKLMKGLSRPLIVKEISKFQAVDRDLALVIPTPMGSGVIQEAIMKFGGEHLQKVTVFDVYQGDKLPEGQKSVAFRLRYQSLVATLTESQIQESVDAILAAVKKRWEIQPR